MDKVEFGKYFAHLRKKSGFKSQRKLATVSGINNATIARIEDGSQKVKPETLKVLSQYLKGVSYVSLLEKAGYLDHLSYKEKEDTFAKGNFEKIAERQIEELITAIAVNRKFTKEVKNDLLEVLKEFQIIENEDITPNSLIRISKESLNINLKAKLNEILIKWTDYYEISTEGLELEDENPLKDLEHTPNENNENDLFSIVHFINQDHDANNNYVIIENSTIKNRPAFAIKVCDDSMINEGLTEGDVVICVEKKYTEPTDISVVLYFNDEVLLRKINYYESFCMLVPANNSMDPEIIEDKDNIEVIGKVIQSRRNYE